MKRGEGERQQHILEICVFNLVHSICPMNGSGEMMPGGDTHVFEKRIYAMLT